MFWQVVVGTSRVETFCSGRRVPDDPGSVRISGDFRFDVAEFMVVT